MTEELKSLAEEVRGLVTVLVDDLQVVKNQFIYQLIDELKKGNLTPFEFKSKLDSINSCPTETYRGFYWNNLLYVMKVKGEAPRTVTKKSTFTPGQYRWKPTGQVYTFDGQFLTIEGKEFIPSRATEFLKYGTVDETRTAWTAGLSHPSWERVGD